MDSEDRARKPLLQRRLSLKEKAQRDALRDSLKVPIKVLEQRASMKRDLWDDKSLNSNKRSVREALHAEFDKARRNGMK